MSLGHTNLTIEQAPGQHNRNSMILQRRALFVSLGLFFFFGLIELLFVLIWCLGDFIFKRDFFWGGLIELLFVLIWCLGEFFSREKI